MKQASGCAHTFDKPLAADAKNCSSVLARSCPEREPQLAPPSSPVLRKQASSSVRAPPQGQLRKKPARRRKNPCQGFFRSLPPSFPPKMQKQAAQLLLLSSSRALPPRGQAKQPVHRLHSLHRPRLNKAARTHAAGQIAERSKKRSSLLRRKKCGKRGERVLDPALADMDRPLLHDGTGRASTQCGRQ